MLRAAALPAYMFLLSTSPALAEVMDKQMSLSEILCWGLGGGLVAFMSTYRNKWLVIFTLPLPLAILTGVISDIHDPMLGPHILREAGMTYVIGTYITLIIFCAANAGGVYLHHKKYGHLAK